MSLERGTTYIELRAKLDQYRRDLEAAEKDSGTAGGKAGRSFGQKFQSFTKKAADIGNKMTTRLTLPILAGFGFLNNAASDLNETISFTGVTFEKAAEEMERWAENALSRLGLARQSALDAANSFGGLFKSITGNVQEAAALSKQMVALAVDMSSAKNVGLEESMTALKSALIGESEPIRRFNVLLSEAALKEYALKNGITENVDAMTEQEKVQARLGLIMEQTTDIQGDYARTADSSANAQRRATEAGKDAAATFGQALTPITARLAVMAANLASKFKNMSAETQTMTLQVVAFVAAAGPMIRALAFIATKIGAIITVAAAVTAAYIKYQKQIERFAERLDAIVNRVSKSILNVLDTMLGPIDEIIVKLLELIGLKDEVRGFIQGDLSQEVAAAVAQVQAVQGVSKNAGISSTSDSGEIKGGTLPRAGTTININGPVVGGTTGIKELQRIQERETRRSGVLLGGT